MELSLNVISLVIDALFLRILHDHLIWQILIPMQILAQNDHWRTHSSWSSHRLSFYTSKVMTFEFHIFVFLLKTMSCLQWVVRYIFSVLLPGTFPFRSKTPHFQLTDWQTIIQRLCSPVGEIFSYRIRHISLWFNELWSYASLNHSGLCRIPYENA